MSNTAPDAESAPTPEEIDLDGLFTLTRQGDGSWRANYGKVTSSRELELRWKVGNAETSLAYAFFVLSNGVDPYVLKREPPPLQALGMFGASNRVEVYEFIRDANTSAKIMGSVVSKIYDAIGSELAVVADHSSNAKEVRKASDRILKKVSKALEAVALRSERKAHGSAATAEVALNTGETREATLPWIALEFARLLVEKEHCLPTKGEIQLAIDERFPEFRGLGKTKWRNTWKECALSTLDQGKPWEFEERKRATRSRTKRA